MTLTQTHNVIFEIATGFIVSLHATATQCDEALCAHYASKPANYPNDLSWGQFKFPAVCTYQDILGSKLDDWRDPSVFISDIRCTQRFASINPRDGMVLEILSKDSVNPDSLPEDVVMLFAPETFSDLVLIGTLKSDWIPGYWVGGEA